VIVPARDAASTIERCLAALLAQDLGAPFEVIVCDDGSRDATRALAEACGDPVRVVHGAGEGVAAARNRALAVATGDVLAFTDADCFPVPGWLAAGLRAMGDADLVQGPILPDPSAPVGPFDRTLNWPRASAWYPTANLFARRAAVAAVGGFRPIGPLRLGEDTALGWDLRRAGARPGWAPGAVVHHAVFPRSAAAFVRYRSLWRGLPAVVREAPELRRELLFGRMFLELRTAQFDLAVAGAVAALASRRRLGAACAAPYALLVAREAFAQRAAGPHRVAAARVSADAVACAALLAGSLQARTPVL
jgi:GT2 family glycosyltransferase